MPHLGPTTLTADEQKLILRTTAKHQRDHLIISLALGTRLRLGEIVGLNVGEAGGLLVPSGYRFVTTPVTPHRPLRSLGMGGEPWRSRLGSGS